MGLGFWGGTDGVFFTPKKDPHPTPKKVILVQGGVGFCVGEGLGGGFSKNPEPYRISTTPLSGLIQR